MALVFLKLLTNDQVGNGRIINTNNIESIFKMGCMEDPKFKMFLMNGEVVNFNQIYYNGDFVNIYKMDQAYSLLTKLDRGEIKDGSS